MPTNDDASNTSKNIDDTNHLFGLVPQILFPLVYDLPKRDQLSLVATNSFFHRGDLWKQAILKKFPFISSEDCEKFEEEINKHPDIKSTKSIKQLKDPYNYRLIYFRLLVLTSTLKPNLLQDGLVYIKNWRNFETVNILLYCFDDKRVLPPTANPYTVFLFSLAAHCINLSKNLYSEQFFNQDLVTDNLNLIYNAEVFFYLWEKHPQQVEKLLKEKKQHLENKLTQADEMKLHFGMFNTPQIISKVINEGIWKSDEIDLTKLASSVLRGRTEEIKELLSKRSLRISGKFVEKVVAAGNVELYRWLEAEKKADWKADDLMLFKSALLSRKMSLVETIIAAYPTLNLKDAKVLQSVFHELILKRQFFSAKWLINKTIEIGVIDQINLTILLNDALMMDADLDFIQHLIEKIKAKPDNLTIEKMVLTHDPKVWGCLIDYFEKEKFDVPSIGKLLKNETNKFEAKNSEAKKELLNRLARVGNDQVILWLVQEGRLYLGPNESDFLDNLVKFSPQVIEKLLKNYQLVPSKKFMQTVILLGQLSTLKYLINEYKPDFFNEEVEKQCKLNESDKELKQKYSNLLKKQEVTHLNIGLINKDKLKEEDKKVMKDYEDLVERYRLKPAEQELLQALRLNHFAIAEFLLRDCKVSSSYECLVLAARFGDAALLQLILDCHTPEMINKEKAECEQQLAAIDRQLVPLKQQLEALELNRSNNIPLKEKENLENQKKNLENKIKKVERMQAPIKNKLEDLPKNQNQNAYEAAVLFGNLEAVLFLHKRLNSKTTLQQLEDAVKTNNVRLVQFIMNRLLVNGKIPNEETYQKITEIDKLYQCADKQVFEACKRFKREDINFQELSKRIDISNIDLKNENKLPKRIDPSLILSLIPNAHSMVNISSAVIQSTKQNIIFEIIIKIVNSAVPHITQAFGAHVVATNRVARELAYAASFALDYLLVYPFNFFSVGFLPRYNQLFAAFLIDIVLDGQQFKLPYISNFQGLLQIIRERCPTENLFEFVTKGGFREIEVQMLYAEFNKAHQFPEMPVLYTISIALLQPVINAETNEEKKSNLQQAWHLLDSVVKSEVMVYFTEQTLKETALACLAIANTYVYGEPWPSFCQNILNQSFEGFEKRYHQINELTQHVQEKLWPSKTATMTFKN